MNDLTTIILLLQWIQQFLMGIRQTVAVAGSFSKWAEVLSGMPQGSVLGPMLFVCYINHLPEAITSCINMYADDTKMFRKINNKINSKVLQRDLDELGTWAKNMATTI